MRQAGFTLVELMVVMAVIGVLGAIAMPQYSEYRTRSFDARALVDLRDAAVAEEAYFAQNGAYVDCIGRSECESILPAYGGSEGVDIAMFAASEDHFTGRSFHPDGAHNSAANAFNWNSALGGLQ